MATVVVDAQTPVEDQARTPENELVGWVMGKVTSWRQVRDNAYKDRWDDWYNTWRGKWTPGSKNRQSERSRLISPASQIAVDLTVAEIIEGIFGREQWFDVSDNIADEQKDDAIAARNQLLEDLYKDGIIQTMIETVLNGALYGTGIVKINIDVEETKKARRTQDGQMQVGITETVKIYPVPVEPGQLVVDPSGCRLDDMLGVAHEFKMPLHKIWARQKSGAYYATPVGMGKTEYSTDTRSEEDLGQNESSFANVAEWHGLVPTKLLGKARAGDDDLAKSVLEDVDEEDLTEALITIANESTLLRAIPNPSVMEDRAVLAYQHDNVPNRFWGRGVMEKGTHPQKALDAELRARADSLAWINNPMLAGDLTKLPPRMNLNVWPGKFWGMKGNPAESLQEFRFGDVNASTFQQTQELNAMVQNATGALDSIMSLRGNVRDETATGSALSASGFIKRSKRTMYNLETFLGEMVRRIMWRKMQFESDRYPVDYDFQVRGTAGIMAREIEQQFMVNLLQFTQQGTPPYLLILKAIFDSSASPSKGEMQKAIEGMLKPDPEAQKRQQQVEELKMQAAVEELRNTRADTALKLAQGDKNKADALLKQIEAEFKDDEVLIQHMKEARERSEVRSQERSLDLQDRKLDIEEAKVVQMGRSKNQGG